LWRWNGVEQGCAICAAQLNDGLWGVTCTLGDDDYEPEDEYGGDPDGFASLGGCRGVREGAGVGDAAGHGEPARGGRSGRGRGGGAVPRGASTRGGRGGLG